MERVAVLVLNWNDLDSTQACLASCPQGVRRYVLNNGCREEALFSTTDSDTAVLETSRNVGFAAGMNILIGAAVEEGAEWLLLLNNDARLLDGAVAAMLRVTEPGVAAVCPAVLDVQSHKIWAFGGRIDLWLGRTTSRFHGANADVLPLEPANVEFASGACLLVSATAVSAIGGFDETYFAYWEETDWCLRATRSGHRILTAPGALVTHEGHASISETRHLHLLLRNVVLFMRRQAQPWHWVTFIPALLLWSIPMWSARAAARDPVGVLWAVITAIAWHLRPVPPAQTAFATAALRHGVTRRGAKEN